MEYKKRCIQALMIAMGCVLVLSGCGGGLPGDVASVSSFCAALGDFADIEPEGAGFDDFDEVAERADRVVKTLPDDAPTDLREVLGATNQVAQIMKRTGGELDPAALNSDDLVVMQAAMEVFERADSEGSNAWIQSTCPGVAAAQNLGGSALGGPATGSASQAQPTAAPISTPTPVPTPTPTPIPVVTEEVLADGNAEIFRARTMDAGAMTRTNGTVDTFFAKADEADDVERLFVEMFTQTADFDANIPSDAFVLEGADGRTTAASTLYDTRGGRMSQVRLDERDSEDFFVAFELPSGFDTDGATVLYGSNDTAPAVFPLSGIDLTVYPLELEVPTPSELFLDPAVQCPPKAATYTIDLAEISLDRRVEFGKLQRVLTGQLALNVGGELINTSDDAVGCGELIHYRDIDLRLIIDGVPVAGEVHRADNRNLGIGDMTDLDISFGVPIGAETVVLVHESEEGETVLAQWDLELSPWFGEPGYTSPPASPTAVLIE